MYDAVLFAVHRDLFFYVSKAFLQPFYSGIEDFIIRERKR